jgi:tetratricopeptide (TPR) repeat protein
VDKAGDIQLHWTAIHETVITLRNDKDYAGVLEFWDGRSLNGLEHQDHIVISFKNIVTHALQKSGRYEEALALNKQVLNDSRTNLDPVQRGYALENAARIHIDLDKTKAANKYKEQTLVQYLSQGLNDRALELIEYFKKK